MNIKWFIERLKGNKTIASNTGYLVAIEFVHLLLPFIALPYVIRTIGVERYGMVAFANTIITYFTIVINYGLDISAVKDVAINKNNADSLNEIVSTVLSIKFVLLILSFFVLIFCIYVVPFMSEHPLLMLYAFMACLSEVLFPVWYFQGIEKMQYITIVKCTSLLFYTIMVFVVIKEQSDFELVALLQSGGSVLSGAIAFLCLLRIEKRRLNFPEWTNVKMVLKESFPFWLSRVSVVFNTNLAKTVSGIFLSMESVAAFDLAQKVVNTILIPTRMLNKAAYPHIARTQNRKFATKFMFFVAFIALIISSITSILAPIIINFFAGYEMVEAINVLRVLCIFVFTTSIVICMGGCILVSFGYPRAFTDSVIISTFFLCFLYLFIYIFDIQTAVVYAFALVLTDIFVLFYRMYYCLKYKLFSLN